MSERYNLTHLRRIGDIKCGVRSSPQVDMLLSCGISMKPRLKRRECYAYSGNGNVFHDLCPRDMAVVKVIKSVYVPGESKTSEQLMLLMLKDG